jgi:transposase
MGEFYAWLGKKKSARIRLAVMDMWKPFRLATAAHAPQAAILFDKFHVMRHLGEALDHVRKSEYGRAGTGATSRARNTHCCRARRTSRWMARRH